MYVKGIKKIYYLPVADCVPFSNELNWLALV